MSFEFQPRRSASSRSPPSSPSPILRPRRGRGSNRCRPATTCRRRCRRASPIRCGCWRANGSSTSSRARTRAARSRRIFASNGVPITSLVGGGVPAATRLPARRRSKRWSSASRCCSLHPKLNAQAGQQLMRQLRAAGLTVALPKLLESFPAVIEAPQDPVATMPVSSGTHCSTASRWTRLRSRTSCGRCSATMPRSMRSARTSALQAASWQLSAASRTAGCSGSTSLPSMATHRARARTGIRTGSNTRSALQADGTQPLLRLEADEYTDGKLDWHTFTLERGTGAGQAERAR